MRATLLVISGSNRGIRYDIDSSEDVVIGRSVGSRIRLDDVEVSRRHARIRFSGDSFVLSDLGSANGLYLNGRAVAESRLRSGDSLRLGSTVLNFQQSVSGHEGTVSSRNIQFIEDYGSSQQDAESAIVQKVHADGSSLATQAPSSFGPELLYLVAEELVTPGYTLESLLQRILELTLEAVAADRGCVLMRDAIGRDLTVIAFARRAGAGNSADPRMPISRSITDYVLQHGQAVRTSDAGRDVRFENGKSIVFSGIREAVCAPMRGRSNLLGVFYLDTTTAGLPGSGQTSARLTDEHLRTVLAVARQSALAIESRQFQEALVRAERFAAMGQTIAVLSHHIKNILQGVRGGSYLIRTGLDQGSEDLIRQGWGIVERNQARIYDLVMDMLSYSKDRVPCLARADLNQVVAEVSELAAARARESGVAFEFRPGTDLPSACFDREGIHRAVLNIVGNAIEAVEGVAAGTVIVRTGYDLKADCMLVAVTDNGPGIPDELRRTVFNVFESSKGSRGTGIGLPVSRKIVREHGGRIRIEGGPGEGTRFVLSWPRGSPNATEAELDRPTMAPGGGGSSVIRQTQG